MNEERDKAALEAYPYRVTGAVDWNLTPRTAFARGWDARGQVTPDEEAIKKVVLDAIYAERIEEDHPAKNTIRYELAEAITTAILALFNEKGNE